MRSRRRRVCRRSPNAVLRWEALGHGVTGLEPLEQRVALAADLAVAFVGQQAAHTWYSPGATAVFKVEVANVGDAVATGAAVTATLGSQITRQTWTAAFSAGATGLASGSGPLATTVTLPAGGKATFTVTAVIAGNASGTLAPSVSATLAGEANTANNVATRTLNFAPAFLAVTDAMGGTGDSTVRIVDPKTGAITASFPAFETPFNGGVSAAIGSFDGTNRPMVAVVPGRGLAAQMRVFALSDAGAWQERPEFRTTAFGGSTRGLDIAVGDFNADGRDDFALADAGGSRVQVFLARQPTPQQPDPVADTPVHTLTRPGVGGGLAAADMGTFADGTVTSAVRQDGRSELILAGGTGAAPVVRVFDLSGARPQVVDTLRPFGGADRAGLTVTTALINEGGIPDIIVTAGGRRPRTEVYDGTVAAAANPRLAAFQAFPTPAPRPVASTVTTIDGDGNGRADTVFASQGFRGAGGVRSGAATGLAGGTVGALAAFGSFTRPVQVASPAVRPNVEATVSPTGLESRVLATGPLTGTAATAGRKLKVDYTGTLLDGTKFDSSRDPGKSPFEFTLGQGQVIKGWDEGLVGRRPGDRIQLVIPAALAYGAAGTANIPPNAPLAFDIEVIAVT